MKRGRPTKYKDEMPDMVMEYVDNCVDLEEEWHKTRSDNGSNSYEKVLRVNLPTYEGLSKHLGVGVSSIELWATKYEDFSRALAYLHGEQKKRLLNETLAGRYNSTIAKLILGSNHGMTEKTDVTSGGEAIKTVINIVKPHD